jgi:hypothetical protein
MSLEKDGGRDDPPTKDFKKYVWDVTSATVNWPLATDY